MAKTDFKSVDEYIASQPADVQAHRRGTVAITPCGCSRKNRCRS